jgi:hypothetical protein
MSNFRKKKILINRLFFIFIEFKFLSSTDNPLLIKDIDLGNNISQIDVIAGT